MEIEIDNFPVSELPSRFNISKQAIYNRLDSVGIRPSKVGKRAFITAEQLQALDRLHEHILEGGSMVELSNSQVDSMDRSSGRLVKSTIGQVDLSIESSELFLDRVEALVKSIAITLPTRSPLWYIAELEKAQIEGWLLTTSEIQELIGVRPMTAKLGLTYQRGCFTFTKAGKIGSQTAWKVTKK
jgi:hypothetical protein